MQPGRQKLNCKSPGPDGAYITQTRPQGSRSAPAGTPDSPRDVSAYLQQREANSAASEYPEVSVSLSLLVLILCLVLSIILSVNSRGLRPNPYTSLPSPQYNTVPLFCVFNKYPLAAIRVIFIG